MSPAPAAIRNIGIIAHIDAGKTTLSERILFYCQKIHKLGEVHDGAATMDFMPEEQERGITIASACITCQWRDISINLVDTPGHVDFTIEVERCLRVLDGAVGVFCGVAGVEPQSETVWRQSERFDIPKIAFINKLDRIGANFETVLEAMRERLAANPVPITVPAGQAENFSGVLDLLAMDKITFDQEDQGRTMFRSPLTEDEQAFAQPWREQLLEKTAEADDEFLSLWLEGKYTPNDLLAALRRATFSRKLTPVYCGSALRNAGVQPLLDGIDLFLPSPRDAPPAEGELPNGKKISLNNDAEGYPVALVFKIVMEKGRKNCFLRLYSGIVHEGEMLCNATSGKQDRIGRLYRLLADRREQLNELRAGDIAAVVGLRDASTGDTYCEKDHPVCLKPIMVYAPVITIALEPRNSDEGKILDEALARYLEEDPTLKLEVDEDNGVRMVSGMGELHLEVLLERLEREYKIKPRSGEPQAVMRETVRVTATDHVNFDKELGKERHQGDVEIAVEPRPRGTGNEITIGSFFPENEMDARKLMPRAYVDAVLEGVRDGLGSGVLGGWPVEDVAVTITNIRREEGLTTLSGCRMAAGQALKGALAKGSPVFLEPLMAIEIITPEDFLGPSVSLFNQLGGKIEDVDDNGGARHVRGVAPLRKLFGFSTRLRSATQGRASFTMTFRAFDQP